MARRTAPPPPPTPGRVVDIDVAEEMRGSFLEYAYSVIYARALPDARDGLKPVQRRILYTMAEMGLRPDRGHVKSARVVGEVMGKLHPHGDGAIYDALVRMAQPFSLRLPLVDGHGNFGSLDDGPAAMRYCVAGDTRVRLADGRSVPIADLVDSPPDSEREIDVDVLDHQGKPVRADRGFNSGVHPVRSVTTRFGFTLTGTDNHPVLCLLTDPTGRPYFGWRLMADLRPGDAVCLAANAATTEMPCISDHQLGVLLGGWVSEGWWSGGRAGFNNTDPALFDDVLRAYDALVGGPRTITSRLLPSGRTLLEIHITSETALRASPLAELADTRSADKRVPERVWRGSVGLKRAFLMALFEGDGCIQGVDTAGSVTLSYSTRSALLAREVQELLLEFGVVASRRAYPRSSGVEHRLLVQNGAQVGHFASRIGFMAGKQRRLERALAHRPPGGSTAASFPELRAHVMRHAPRGGRNWLRTHAFTQPHRWAADRALIATKIGDPSLVAVMDEILGAGYHVDTVRSVEAGGEELVYSIRVASDDHSFLGGGFVNHNTEARLASAALLMTASLDEDVVDFGANYDGREQEPSVLPAAVPNLLVNGASGIAVGMATNMAPHNLGEVVAAARHLLAHPQATLDDLMRFVPGPDLPTGGTIIGLDGVRDAYETGRGSFRVRATTRVENVTARRQAIVVTELPYTVGPEKVIDRIKDAVLAKKLTGIADVIDLSDHAKGLHLVIELKAGFVPEAVLEQLYRLTPMEDSFGVNNVALVDGRPRTLGLRELLDVYLQHRIDVVRRRSEFRRRKAADRLHLVDGLLIAIVDIDEVIALIRSSNDTAEARERLIAVFDLSEVQASYILDMPLRRLTKYSRIELEAEGDALRAEIDSLTELLSDEGRLREAVSDELAEVARAHATPRRTVLLESAGLPAPTATSLEVADDPCLVLLSSTGLLARTTSTDPLPADGTRAKHDVVVSAVEATARGEVGLVTSRGRILRVGVLEMPALPPTAGAPSLAGGAPLREFVTLAPEERALCLTTLDPDSPGIAIGTERGVVKRVLPDVPLAKADWEIVRLEPGDRVVGAAELRTGEEDLAFITSDGQLLRFHASAVRPQGRAAGGMAGVRLDPSAKVVFFGALLPDEGSVVVTVSGSSAALPGTEPGSVKVTRYAEYPAKGRGTGGVRCHRFLKGEDAVTLAWAGTGPARAAAPSGAPVPLPPATGRRDGSGSPSGAPLGGVGGPPAAGSAAEESS